MVRVYRDPVIRSTMMLQLALVGLLLTAVGLAMPGKVAAVRFAPVLTSSPRVPDANKVYFPPYTK